MQSDATLKFRLGVFVLGSLFILAMLIVLFGEFPDFFRSQVHYSLKVPQAPGVVEGTPVRKSGIRIGEVSSVHLNPETGEVTLGIVVERRYQLLTSDIFNLTRGLVLGETAINFIPNPEVRGPAAPDGHVFTGKVGDDLNKALTEARDLVPLGREAIEEVKQAAKNFNQMVPELKKTNAELQVTVTNLGRAAESVDNLLRTNSDRITTMLDNVSRVAGELGNLFTPENNKKLARLIDNAATVSDRLPGFFSEQNRANLEGTLKNAKESSENLAQVLNEDNRKAISEAIKNLNSASDRMAKLFSDENQKNVTEILANAKRGSEQLDGLMKNLGETSTQARETMKSLSARVETVGKEVEEGVKDARVVIKRAGASMERFDEAMVNISAVAKTLNERAPNILKNVEQITTDAGEFTKALATGDGTLRRLVTDPSLYNNMNDAAAGVNQMVCRFQQIVKDIGVFADKIARHPEVLGARGAIAPGSGIK